jgi:hypothetical protein
MVGWMDGGREGGMDGWLEELPEGQSEMVLLLDGWMDGWMEEGREYLK